jgi:hypothetical protein
MKFAFSDEKTETRLGLCSESESLFENKNEVLEKKAVSRTVFRSEN